MRAVLVLFLAILATASASSQVHHLGLRSAKLEKKHAKRLLEVRGQRGLLVEEVRPIKRQDGRFVLVHDRLYEFYLQDPGDPEAMPYRMKRGQRVPTTRRRVLALQGSEIDFLVPLMAQESFASLAEEYRYRVNELDSLLRQRDEEEKASDGWLARQRLVLRSADRLGAWLRATGFTEAAEDLAKRMARDAKRSRVEGGPDRLRRAWEAIGKEAVPDTLKEADQELHGGRSGFQVLRSPHFRVIFERRVQPGRVREVLREAEAALEDFRVRHTDARAAEESGDPIGDELLMEFFFGREDREAFEGYFVLHYGQSWGADRERQLERRGRDFHQHLEPHFVEYWRFNKDTDLESIVLHGLGHALAELAWAGHYGPVTHDWLREALGYRVEWERRGRNVIVCVGMSALGRYGLGAEREAFASSAAGTRAVIRRLALADPTPLADLLLRELHELDEENVAKGWMFFEWLQQLPSSQGEAWLLELEDAGYQGGGGFLRRMRAVSRECFDLTGSEDPLRAVEERWRRWLEPDAEAGAEGGGRAGDEGR